MNLGPGGKDWIEDIYTVYTDSASLCTTWQQEMFESFYDKVSSFGDNTFVSEKQLLQLNKIADIYGIPEWICD